MELLDWGFPILSLTTLLVIFLATVWSMVWKGIALWRAGRNTHLVWFIALFVVNTLGILELIYIFAFSRKTSPQIAT